MPSPTLDLDDPIAAPRPRDEQRPAPFPLVASVAPLLASGVLWALTQSSFALVFALLSPVVAVAGMLDGHRHARRRRRQEQARYDRELQVAHRQLLEHHDAERAARFERAPGSAVALRGEPARRWRADPQRFAVVSLGHGTVPSSVRVSGAGSDDESGLRGDAATLSDAPLEADAVHGIGVTGQPVLARAVARGYAIQLADAFGPDRLRLRVESDAWGWAVALPHADGDGEHELELREDVLGDTRDPARRSGARRALIAVARTPEQLPPECRIVVCVEGAAAARIVVATPDVPRGPIVPELVPQPAAVAFAAELADRARVAGLHTRALPEALAFAELQQPDGPALRCAIGRQTSGAFELDLANSGPHAVVAGTTGSGKSELLVTWVAAIASKRTPEEAAFLLVDFKGGTAFAPLLRLPHTVGVITDLAHGEALRALQSLQAELRRRERVLADRGARDIEHADGSLGRLVIVVDEFAAMLDAFPELNGVFVDIAARGRALGIHLVLCTQRVTGVVRDALLANCALRLSLRVTSAADSVAVVGTDAAASLSPSTPGRCVVVRDGETNVIQVAVTSPADIEAVAAAAGRDGARATPPWLDPLPAEIPASALQAADDGAIAIGLCDRPDEQRRHTVFYRPAEEHLLGLGMRGTGKSGLIRLIAEHWDGVTIDVRGDEEQVWDAIESACTLIDAAGTDAAPTVVLIDDLDILLERFEAEYRDAFADRVLSVLRDGPRAGLSVACTASRMTAALRPLLGLMGTAIVLGQTGKQEHLLAGAPAELFQERARAGFGVWRGHRVQLAHAATPSQAGSAADETQRPDADVEATAVRFPGGSTTVLVSRAPGRAAAGLRHALGRRAVVMEVAATGPHGIDLENALAVTGGERISAASAPAVVLVADPDGWQSQWTMLTRLRGHAQIVFDGCSVADLRGILRTRVLPPPLGRIAGRVWRCGPGGPVERAMLPAPVERHESS